MVNKSLHQDPRLVFSAQEASRFLQKHFDVQHIAHPQTIYKAIKKVNSERPTVMNTGYAGSHTRLKRKSLSAGSPINM